MTVLVIGNTPVAGSLMMSLQHGGRDVEGVRSARDLERFGMPVVVAVLATQDEPLAVEARTWCARREVPLIRLTTQSTVLETLRMIAEYGDSAAAD